MNSVHAILILIIRLWAAGALVQALIWGPVAVSFAFENYSETQIYNVIQVIDHTIWMTIGVVAWFAAPWIARRVHPEAANSTINSDVDAHSLVEIGSFLIGAFYLVQYGIPSMVEWGSWIVQRMGSSPVDLEQMKSITQKHDDRFELISNVLVFLAACIMMFRPYYLARIFGWLRSSGHYEDPKATS